MLVARGAGLLVRLPRHRPPSSRALCTCAPFPLPPRIVDAHHHVYDPPANTFHAFLHALCVPPYTAEAYMAEAASLPVTQSVHVEAIADDGAAEAEWISSLVYARRCNVGAIVAGKNLSPFPNVFPYMPPCPNSFPYVTLSMFLLYISLR